MSEPTASGSALRSGRPLRGVHSFVTRRGRLTSGQARALQTLGPRYLLPFDPQTPDLVANLANLRDSQGQAFRRTRLEIGSGMGEATANIASQMPDTLFLACEVHEAGVGALLKLIGALGLENVRILQHDAVQVLHNMIARQTLDGVHIFFPDPWPKKRHHKRRLIQAPLVHQLALRLKPGACIHCATDWQEYAEQMLEVLSAEALLQNTAEGYATRPEYRPMTKFERRGIRLGHGVWDLVFKRR